MGILNTRRIFRIRALDRGVVIGLHWQGYIYYQRRNLTGETKTKTIAERPP